MRAIDRLRSTLSIDRAKMRLRVSVGHKHAKNLHNTLKGLIETVEVEDWEEGNLEMVSFFMRFKLIYSKIFNKFKSIYQFCFSIILNT